MPLTVGREIPTSQPPPDGTYSGYIPIYLTMATTAVDRVIGFGEAEVVVNPGETSVSIVRRASRIGTENVSATPCFSLSISPQELSAVLASRATSNNPFWPQRLRGDRHVEF